MMRRIFVVALAMLVAAVVHYDDAGVTFDQGTNREICMTGGHVKLIEDTERRLEAFMLETERRIKALERKHEQTFFSFSSTPGQEVPGITGNLLNSPGLMKSGQAFGTEFRAPRSCYWHVHTRLRIGDGFDGNLHVYHLKNGERFGGYAAYMQSSYRPTLEFSEMIRLDTGDNLYPYRGGDDGNRGYSWIQFWGYCAVPLDTVLKLPMLDMRADGQSFTWELTEELRQSYLNVPLQAESHGDVEVVEVASGLKGFKAKMGCYYAVTTNVRLTASSPGSAVEIQYYINNNGQPMEAWLPLATGNFPQRRGVASDLLRLEAGDTVYPGTNIAFEPHAIVQGVTFAAHCVQPISEDPRGVFKRYGADLLVGEGLDGNSMGAPVEDGKGYAWTSNKRCVYMVTAQVRVHDKFGRATNTTDSLSLSVAVNGAYNPKSKVWIDKTDDYGRAYVWTSQLVRLDVGDTVELKVLKIGGSYTGFRDVEEGDLSRSRFFGYCVSEEW